MRALFAVFVLIGFAISVFFSPPVRSDQTAASPRGSMSGAIGPEVTFSPTDVHSGGYDFVSGSDFQLTVGFQAEAYYRFAFPWFALGLMGGATWPPRNLNPCSAVECKPREHLYTLWRTSLDAKLYPILREKVELWFAVGAGIAGAVFFNGAQVAPSFGGGMGFDVIFEKYITVGMEARMLFHLFGSDNGFSNTMNNSVWASFTFFKLGIRIPLKSK